MIEATFEELPDVSVKLYEPKCSPNAAKTNSHHPADKRQARKRFPMGIV
jgi:hypothetical protein